MFSLHTNIRKHKLRLPGQVTFENKKAEMHLIGVDELRKLFVAGNTSELKLVFVSACHSESVGRSFAEAGVPHVVAVSSTEEILDLASQEFARAFYTALFAGRTVKAAFEIGQAAVKFNGDIPLVYRNEAVSESANTTCCLFSFQKPQ
jgi:hypothetical protein